MNVSHATNLSSGTVDVLVRYLRLPFAMMIYIADEDSRGVLAQPHLVT